MSFAPDKGLGNLDRKYVRTGTCARPSFYRSNLQIASLLKTIANLVYKDFLSPCNLVDS